VLEQLADRCPNLVGFKNGIGDIELMVSIRQRLGERLACMNVQNAAEMYALPYQALGVPVYASAVFSFVPKTAMDFYSGRRLKRGRLRSIGKLVCYQLLRLLLATFLVFLGTSQFYLW
jgi:5-dehydro-4-deoxyglucarate dehydratase